MAGINQNLGNLKLQNLQLSKTVNVGTPKDENTKIEDSRKAAVWVSCNGNWNNDFFNKVKHGDLIIVAATQKDKQIFGTAWEPPDEE